MGRKTLSTLFEMISDVDMSYSQVRYWTVTKSSSDLKICFMFSVCITLKVRDLTDYLQCFPEIMFLIIETQYSRIDYL